MSGLSQAGSQRLAKVAASHIGTDRVPGIGGGFVIR
jgi:hypothetical protein